MRGSAARSATGRPRPVAFATKLDRPHFKGETHASSGTAYRGCWLPCWAFWVRPEQGGRGVCVARRSVLQGNWVISNAQYRAQCRAPRRRCSTRTMQSNNNRVLACWFQSLGKCQRFRLVVTVRARLPATEVAPSNKALQTDKVKLSRLLHSQEPRQFTFAAELSR